MSRELRWWLFDLDNTLYAPSCQLFDLIDKRMTYFISESLSLSVQEARALQKQYFQCYGTTLRGMMGQHNTDPDDFLQFVHAIDYGRVPPNPGLVEAIRALPGEKIICTNGTRSHALNVLKRLGDENLFEHIFDIKDADYVPKPQREYYDMLVRHFGPEPDKAIFFEDIAENLKIPHTLGMRTVWMVNDHQWSSRGSDESHVHHSVEDLTVWLSRWLKGAAA